MTAIIDMSLRIIFIAGIVRVVLALLRVRAGRVRHAVWVSVLMTMMVLPFAPKWLPTISVPLPDMFGERPRTMDPQLAPVRIPESLPVPVVGTPASSQPVPLQTRWVPAPAVARPAQPRSWQSAAMAVWVAGSLVMLIQLFLGWRAARKLASSSTPTTIDGVFESELVAAPVTVGIRAPRIILPKSWQLWPVEMTTAVLAHERAHVRRRDTLVAFLAQINRCVYWFHPIAWWLERRIASSAEQACDDEVVKASGTPQQYANLLVKMADAVRRHGGRVAWQGVGMATGGSLNYRIDRVLSGAASEHIARSRQFATWAVVAGVLVLGLACRQQSALPLREDPEFAQRLKEMREQNEAVQQARNMTPEQVDALEAVVAKNPDDLDATRRLLTFYRDSGPKVMGWNEMVAARRPHVLRAIERHPESDVAMWPLAKSMDPEGWAKARALWLKHVENPNVTAKLLGRAADFFGISEKAVAEQLLLRANTLDPGGPPQPAPRKDLTGLYEAPWIRRLGWLYARAIIGNDVYNSASLEEMNSPFAADARRKLDASTDPLLLRSAGVYLTDMATPYRDGTVGYQRIKLGFDVMAVGESYLDRSIALNPDAESTKSFVAQRARMRAQKDHYEWLTGRLGTNWTDAPVEQVAALSATDQLDMLIDLGSHAIMWAENIENTTKDQAEFRRLMTRAKSFSDMALTLAEKFKTDVRYPAFAFQAHVNRGVVAVRDGDHRLAVQHLQLATALVTMDTASEGGIWPRLTNYLLKDGERETVAKFYEKVSNLAGVAGVVSAKQDFAEAAKAIREGRMPAGYQRAMTPH